jgi:hypothetical protein
MILRRSFSTCEEPIFRLPDFEQDVVVIDEAVFTGRTHITKAFVPRKMNFAFKNQ